MAIFLIKDSDMVNPNPEKDKCCYKKGDIVEIFDDSKPCVIPPAPPFWIVKITGLSKGSAQKYITSQYDSNDKMLLRRIYKVSWKLVPTTIKNKLSNDRYFEIEWSKVKSYIHNKITLESEYWHQLPDLLCQMQQ